MVIIAVIVILKWQIIKDAWNGTYIPPVSNKKPFHYCGFNGYHRCRRKNSFNGMKRFFKKSGRRKW
jgi:hypothetical protein